MTAVEFRAQTSRVGIGVHHASAAAGNAAVASEALSVLSASLAGESPIERILLRAAAGAGKSFTLRKMVVAAVGHEYCSRVAIVAFTNKQTQALAGPLGDQLGREAVCLYVADGRVADLPDDLRSRTTIATTAAAIPIDCTVLVTTCHKLGGFGERKRQENQLGNAVNGETPYDVLFVDEAWQIPHYLFDQVRNYAPVTVGVGDVGQLPPLEAGANPWRGDPGYNPYRAWPTDFDGDDSGETWSKELPAVWRPAAGHLGLWRAFYPEWTTLNCVAAPGDRGLQLGSMNPLAESVWRQVGTGIPTLLEVDGLPEPEAADVDLPLMGFVKQLLDDLFGAGFVLIEKTYNDSGEPKKTKKRASGTRADGDPLVTVLATRNQAVDDAAAAVDWLSQEHSLGPHDLTSSTVDSYQGQTNGITVAIHPLNGATDLNEFNSAFGRLAVTCTRATHGLLILARPGLDRLLTEAPARPGIPFGEPGNRQLPRQTHQRILNTFARGRVTV